MGGLERSPGLLLQDGAEVESDGRRFVIMQLLGTVSNCKFAAVRDGRNGAKTLERIAW